MISDDTAAYTAALAELLLSGEERERAKKDLSEILGYIERMNELDTEGIEPVPFLFPAANVFRGDAVTNKDRREELLANAPDRSGDFFRVPKTVD